jgi:hypothetical protein
MGEATAERGGRSKRIVRVTPAGLADARAFYTTMLRVSRKASWAHDADLINDGQI